MSNAFETLLLLILDHCSLIIVLCLLFFTTEAAELHGGFTMTIATEDTEFTEIETNNLPCPTVDPRRAGTHCPLSLPSLCALCDLCGYCAIRLSLLIDKFSHNGDHGGTRRNTEVYSGIFQYFVDLH